MSIHLRIQSRNPPAAPPISKVILALVAGILLFFGLLMAAGITYDLYYAGRIYPGVSVAGIDVSGLPPSEAASKIADELNFPDKGKIAFQDGSRVWVTHPSQLGLTLDPQNSALAAYRLGRSGLPLVRWIPQLAAWYFGRDLPPLFVYDERSAQAYLEGLAVQVNRVMVEASLSVKGVDVLVVPGQVGRSVDISTTLSSLQRQLTSLTDGIVPLQIHESHPAILDAGPQAENARRILSAPLVFKLAATEPGDPGPWTLGPEQLAGMLKIQRVDTAQGGTYQVELDADKLRTFLKALAPKLSRTPTNARYIFNDQTHQLESLQKAVIGRSSDIDATLKAVNEKLAQGQHDIDLSMQATQPAVSDGADAAKLGITQLVSAQTTYFYGSTGSRIQNIQRAAARFHGVLVPPGAVFSFAETLGDVSLDTGFAEALIIYGNRTIKGVGGGVCQVSTTLFRTVFFGGYPVIERHPHAYRVYYYEQNAGGGDNVDMAGLDAAVFVPEVDFKFKNDSPNWLLMETYTNVKARTLTWKFYSTSDGRTVKWDSSGLQNTVDPAEPVYQENPDLSPGEINQVDWQVAGADVSIERTVLRDGQSIYQDDFATHYLPWRSVFEYGPGTDITKLIKKKH